MEIMHNDILRNLFIYGVSFNNYDTIDISNDIITNIRKRFLVSHKPASNKLYRSANGFNYVYSYNFSDNRPFQWKVVKNKKVVEEIEQLLSDKYLIAYYDDNGKDLKKVFFDAKHRWFKTNYYSNNSNDNLICSLVPKELDKGTAILKYMTGAVYPERLYSCTIPSCDEVRARVLSMVPAPDVSAITDRGLVYFMAEADKDNYENILASVEHEYAEETAPEVYVTKEDAEGGFNLSVNDFNMNKNLNRTFDISLADAFEEEVNSVDTVAEVAKQDSAAETQPEINAGSVDQAISDVVKEINARTSLDINAEEILRIDIGDTEEQNRISDVNTDEYIVFDDSDPSIDEKLRHIDSVLVEASLLTPDKQLMIGDSVVDDDYISSIIDGIMTTAFQGADKEVDLPDNDENDQSSAFNDIPVYALESEANVEAVSLLAEDEIIEGSSEEAIEDTLPNEVINVPEDTNKIPENNEFSDNTDDVFVVGTDKDYLSDNTPAATLESRGDSFYYYGDVDSNGNRNGRGRTLTSDGRIAYEGEYFEDKRNGKGSFYFRDGSLCYWGDWSDNVRSGFGVGISSDDNAIHSGNWCDNKPSGLGVRFDSEGNLMFISSSCEDKKKGITISDLNDTSFTVRVYSEEEDAFVQREFNIKDLL